METILHFLNEFWGLLFGAGGAFATFLYYSQNKRLKNAEARSSEIDNLTSIIEHLKTEIGRLQDKQKSLEERLNVKDEMLTSKYREIEQHELKVNIQRRAINCAFTCKESKDCPVLLKKAELENAQK